MVPDAADAIARLKNGHALVHLPQSVERAQSREARSDHNCIHLLHVVVLQNRSDRTR